MVQSIVGENTIEQINVCDQPTMNNKSKQNHGKNIVIGSVPNTTMASLVYLFKPL